MDHEEVNSILMNMKWPTDRTGYFVPDESKLPLYRDLGRKLREKGIHQKMTWSKEECLNALGEDVELPSKEQGDCVSRNLIESAYAEIVAQREKMNQVLQMTDGLCKELEQILIDDEATNFHQQQAMITQKNSQ